jgi:hypothetical protein
VVACAFNLSFSGGTGIDGLGSRPASGATPPIKLDTLSKKMTKANKVLEVWLKWHEMGSPEFKPQYCKNESFL